MKVSNFADYVYDENKPYCLVDYTDCFSCKGDLHYGKIIFNIIEPLNIEDIIELFIDSICTFFDDPIDVNKYMFEIWKENKNV